MFKNFIKQDMMISFLINLSKHVFSDLVSIHACRESIQVFKITAPLQYVIQQLASLDWYGEGQIIPSVKAVYRGLELILRSGDKVLKSLNPSVSNR